MDYERDAVLKVLNGLPHGSGAWFNLIWKDETIRFGAYERGNGYISPEDKSKGLRKLFTIFQIKIPEALEAQREEILSLISDALSEYGELYGTAKDIVDVQVDFSQCSYYRS